MGRGCVRLAVVTGRAGTVCARAGLAVAAAGTHPVVRANWLIARSKASSTPPLLPDTLPSYYTSMS
jgi:hypothetical protein